jgi:hypothetical protein
MDCNFMNMEVDMNPDEVYCPQCGYQSIHRYVYRLHFIMEIKFGDLIKEINVLGGNNIYFVVFNLTIE